MPNLFALAQNVGRGGGSQNIRGKRRYQFAMLFVLFVMTLSVACAGAQGSTGTQGAAGAQGAAGEAGPQGTAGETGPAGPAGNVGPAGAAGAAGTEGTAGAAGPSDKAIATVLWMGDPGFRESGDKRNRNFLPNNVEVSSGDTIRIVIAGFHQVAVYKVADGTTRQQVTSDPNAFVDTTIAGVLSDGDIGDTNNRIAIGPSPRENDPDAVNRDNALGMDLTIAAPGRYLVICAIKSHFLEDDPAANGGMFGFIDVSDDLAGQGDASLTGAVGYPADVTVRMGDPRFLGRGDRRNRNFLPNTLEVNAGDRIRVVIAGFHQVAVYKVAAGTTRQDVTNDPNAYVDTTINGPFNDGDIGDTNNRIALGASPRVNDPDALNRSDAVGMDLTITEPGRYLLICNIRSHYLEDDPAANGGMFGFITVR